MTREPIPVVPAAHYMCGGVCTDARGRTDVPGLYAAGEVGMTGLHGANRLASNSLLEAAVMADRAAADTLRLSPVENAPTQPTPSTPARSGCVEVNRMVGLRQQLQRIMWDRVGILRSDAGLAAAVEATSHIAAEVATWHEQCPLDGTLNELRSMATVAGLVAQAAQQRHESRGGHHNSDHAVRDDVHWQRPIYLRRKC